MKKEKIEGKIGDLVKFASVKKENNDIGIIFDMRERQVSKWLKVKEFRAYWFNIPRDNQVWFHIDNENFILEISC